METKSSSDKLALAAQQNVKEREYWLNQLSGDLIKSYFPYDYKKDGENRKNTGMEAVKFRFPDALGAKSLKLSGGVDVKLHMILVTGLVILLNKYTGNKDIIIGSPILKQEIEGEFINRVLVFRNHVNDNTNFKELLMQVRETIIKANENQNYPMEILLEELNMPVQGNEFPLFDVAILLERFHDKHYIQDIHYNMMFSFSRTGESIEGVLEYNSLLYRESTINRIVDHYMDMLDQVLLNMNLQLSRIEILSERERKEILFDFNGTEAGYPKDKTLHRLFEEQVERTPDNIALVGTTHPQHFIEFLSYRQFNEKSDLLALRLKQNGVKTDTIVAILLHTGIDMPVGLMGILKSGGAYLPIDPDLPEERIAFMLADSSAGILVANRFLSSKKPGGWAGEMIFLEDQNKVPEPQPQPGPVVPPPRGLAYVIYTSGSTGTPKGVMVEHRNVIAYLHAYYREFAVDSTDTVIQMASYSFDVFVEEVFPVLLKGGRIVIPGASEMMDINLFFRLIAEHQVNIIDCTPLLLNEFNRLHAAVPGGNPLQSVKTFISGGDVLKGTYVDKLLNIGTVYNTYGPTETTVCATYYNYSHANGNNRAAGSPGIPIGKSIPNYKIYILAENNKPMPIGVAGELCISGPGVTRGYLNRPELTADKFLTAKTCDHFSPFTFHLSPLYRTGDLARWLPDGNIEFLGRIDHQVKIRGYRIELGEIENRLTAHREIREAVVIESEQGGNSGIDAGDKYLCSYIVSNRDMTVSELKEFLSRKLPEYMIPAFFIQVEKIPVTPHGKVDRKKLLKDKGLRPKLDADYEPPGTEMEKLIANIWKEVLKREKVGIHDNYFDIGGNSMNILELHSKLNRMVETDIPVVTMFELTTVRAVATYLRPGETGENSSHQRVNIDRTLDVAKGKNRRRQKIERRMRKEA